MTYALLDGDIICYRAAIVQQSTFKWDSNTTTTMVDDGAATKAADYALETVKAWTKLAGCKRAVLAFTGSGNFRKLILPTYKSNRTSGKPLVYQETVMAVADRYRTARVDGLEGDDILGIMATGTYQGNSVVVSIDKDLKTIPGRYFNPMKASEGIMEVDEAAADLWWMFQTLIGDTSDGYKGLPGTGRVKAEKILGRAGRPLQAYWRGVYEAFRAKGLTMADALQQARVARILRSEDWNKIDRTIRLWHPTTPEWVALDDGKPDPVVLAEQAKGDNDELGKLGTA